MASVNRRNIAQFSASQKRQEGEAKIKMALAAKKKQANIKQVEADLLSVHEDIRETRRLVISAGKFKPHDFGHGSSDEARRVAIDTAVRSRRILQEDLLPKARRLKKEFIALGGDWNAFTKREFESLTENV